MREIRLYGLEGGGAVCSPYPYPGGAGAPADAACREEPLKIPSVGGVTRSAGVGSPIDNPHPVVSNAHPP
jgi:hypothetical protein